jgi:hypothetical protein
MEWYVLWHEFNEDKVEKYNIFGHRIFDEGVRKALKKYTTFKEFKEELRKALFYTYGSKCEYEILCKGFCGGNEWFKIDIYDQVLPNLDILARYIVNYHNSDGRRRHLEI